MGGQGDFAFVREFTVLEFECAFESKCVMCSLWQILKKPRQTESLEERYNAHKRRLILQTILYLIFSAAERTLTCVEV